MIDKKNDEKESLELKKIYNHYIDKRKNIMNSTNFQVGDVFGDGDVISKDSISPEQITKLNNFFSQNDVNININFKFNFFNLEERKKLSTE